MADISIASLVRIYGRIGLLSFGGPAAQIALMHRELVEDRTWLTEEQFLSALSFCMLLPGPEAMQLATYSGWRLRGYVGGIIAGGLFVLPGALVVLILSLTYAYLGALSVFEAAFTGIKAAVVFIVIHALIRLSSKAFSNRWQKWIAVFAFVSIFFLALPFPLIILIAGGIGFITSKPSSAPKTKLPAFPYRASVTIAALWAAPIAAAWLVGATFLVQVGLFFSKLAVMTFGGAYAVLAYMGQEVVGQKQWITTEQMVDGLGLAETTPGPLILVTEFVGFQAGFATGGATVALVAAAMTLWVTFIPCFLWIFAGAPFVEHLISRPKLRGALQAITAAVVGVIANLSLWFAMHVFFGQVVMHKLWGFQILIPEFGTVNLTASIMAVIAGILMFRFKVNIIVLVFGMASLGALTAAF